MAGEAGRDISKDRQDFAGASLVDVIVPEASEFGIEENINSINTEGEVTNSSHVLEIRQRSLLYFDELIPAYVVFRTPYCDENQIKSDITRLSISIEVFAFDSHSLDGKTAESTREVIWSGKVNTAEDPVIVVQVPENGSSKGQVCVFWKLMILLGLSNAKFQTPMIAFRPSATMRSKQLGVSAGDRYLPSGFPAPLNLLQPLQDDPGLDKVVPNLTAQRLSRIVPATQVSAKDVIIKNAPQRSFPTMTALCAKVRYSKSSLPVGKYALDASLDIEATSSMESHVSLEGIDVQLAEGFVKNLTDIADWKLPLEFLPGDNLVLLYRLHQSVEPLDTPSAVKSLTIAIHATVQVSEFCRPRIRMRWKKSIDFLALWNSSFKRPTSLSLDLQDRTNRALPPSIQGLGVSTDRETDQSNQAIGVDDLGITVTFTGPEKVQVGRPFCWDIFVVNRSEKPLRLAFIVISKRRRGDSRKQSTKIPTSIVGNDKECDVAEAVVDENDLYAGQKNANSEAARLVSLSTDVRIGPLNPDSCYTTELKFLPLAKGVLQVEAIRLIDILTNQAIDFRDLPDVLGVEPFEED